MHQISQSPQSGSMINLLWKTFSHIMIIVLAVGIAFLLPNLAQFVLYDWWPHVMLSKKWLLASEASLSAILIPLFNLIKIAWDNWRVLMATKQAALVCCIDTKVVPSNQLAKELLARSSTTRDISILALTGFDTFAKPNSRFNGVVATCYEARVMLLNPTSTTACKRVDAIPDQSVNLHSLREEIRASINYLTSLYRIDMRVRLKFYAHEPVWKVVVLGKANSYTNRNTPRTKGGDLPSS